MVIILLIVPSARGDFYVGGPIPGVPSYNYAPSVMNNGNIQQFWWCGNGSTDGGYIDYIYYQYYTPSTGVWSPRYNAITPTPGAWDSGDTCDPSVVQGTFYVPGIGGPYTYAMYYGANNNGVGPAQIGVAFSTDGMNWVKYPGNPIIAPQCPGTSSYGAGQPSAYNSNGVSNITLFHSDSTDSNCDPPAQNGWVRTSTDGINFTAPNLIPPNDNSFSLFGSDYGYDPNTSTWYAAVPGPGRPGRTINYSFDIRKTSDLFGRSWQLLGTISTNLTGYLGNHNPGFARDPYGNVSGSGIEIFFGAGGDTQTFPWRIVWATWLAQPNSLAFNGYWKSGAGHWTTTGIVPYGYNLERALGYLLMGFQSGTSGVYGCQVPGSNDQFVSLDPNCEGQFIYGLNGWIYSSPPVGVNTQALYRCYTGLDHFVSPDPGCEGQRTEFLLGYAKTGQ